MEKPGKITARKLGGTRLVRGDDFSQSILDVEHPKFAIDCKWRTTLAIESWYNKLCKDNEKIYGKGNKIPILVIKKKGMRGELVVILLEDFIKVVNEDSYKIMPNEKEIENDQS